MDKAVTEYFAGIVALARSAFEQVEAAVDATPERAILRMQALYGVHRVSVSELLSAGVRKYRCYVLRRDFVVAGFDNSPDPRTIRQKYGRIDKNTVGQMIPHLHLNDKTELILTAEMGFESFIAWLKENVPPDDW